MQVAHRLLLQPAQARRARGAQPEHIEGQPRGPSCSHQAVHYHLAASTSNHHSRAVEMGVQISIMLMIASASSHSQLVESQETSGKGDQLSAIEQTAALVAASVEKELSEPVHQANGARLAPGLAQGAPEAGQLLAAHRAHLARFLKTAIGNKQRELAESTEQPLALLRQPVGAPTPSTRQKATPPVEGAMMKLLLNELSSLDIGRSKMSASATHAPSSAKLTGQSAGNLLVSGRGALAMSAPAASPTSNQRRQQQNRHIPCFFNAITCF